MTTQQSYTAPQACQPEKSIHDICFFNWYQDEFLSGKGGSLDVCNEQWETYQSCLHKKIDAMNLQKDIEEAKIATQIS